MKKLNIRTPLKDLTCTKSRSGGVVITGLRGRHQLDRYSCGPAVVATIVDACTGELRKEDWKVIIDACQPCTEEGTPTRRLTASLRAIGLDYTIRYSLKQPGITKWIARGDMIITTTRMPFQDDFSTHWVLTVGATKEEALILNHTWRPLHTQKWIPWHQMMFEDEDQQFIIVHTELEDKVCDLRD